MVDLSVTADYTVIIQYAVTHALTVLSTNVSLTIQYGSSWLQCILYMHVPPVDHNLHTSAA